MNSAEAKQILKDNYECKENSLIYLLHEKNMFSTEQFWKYYDSISVLAENDEETKLDVSENKELTNLRCDNNNLTRLDVKEVL